MYGVSVYRSTLTPKENVTKPKKLGEISLTHYVVIATLFHALVFIILYNNPI